MIGDELKNYIQDALKSGKSKEEIRQSLIGAGRSEAEVVQALNSADSATAQTPQEAQVPAASGTKPNTISTLKSSADLIATVVQKYLQFEPQVEYTIKKVSSGSSIFEITPAVALEENKVYSLTIAESPIAARTYSWAYQVKAPFQVIASLPRDKSNGAPTNTGIEITFNRENLLSPEKSFEISPSVQGRFEIHRNVLVFVPLQELNPQTVYTIKIKAGINAQGSDDTLSEDTEIKFETGEKYTYQLRSEEHT